MQNVIQWNLNNFFFQKLTKIAPVCDTFEYTSLLNTSSKLDIYTFYYRFSPSPFTKILVKCQQATASDLPFYDIFAPQKVPFSKISDDVIACDL